MKVTVILTCYKRFKNFETVIQGWLDQDEVDEVIVFDNSGSFKTNLPVIVISTTANFGPQAKYEIAMFAKNDCIVFGDDDILVEKGLVSDFMKHWSEDKLVGMIGRVFDGDSYYTSTGYRGRNVSKPTEVDWMGGGCTMAHRDNCIMMDIRSCPAAHVDDLWWNYHIKPATKFYVVPTTKYRFLEEDKDEHALHLAPEIKGLREKYYREWGFQR